MNTKHRLFLALVLGVLLCVCLAPSAFAAGNVSGHTVEALQNAIAAGADTFTLDGNMEIPAGTRVEVPGTCIVVPSGKTLTVKGRLNVVTLKLTGGIVDLKADSRFNVYQTLTYTSGSIIVRANSRVGVAGAGILSKLNTIFSFPEPEGDVDLLFYAENANELSSIMANTVNVASPFHSVVCVDFDCEFNEATTIIHEHLSLRFRKGFSLPQGCTLQMPQIGNFIVNKDAAAEIYGKVSGSGLIVDQGGYFRVYGEADFDTVTLNGEIDTYPSTKFNVWEGMTGLYNGRPNGTLHAASYASIMIEAKDLDLDALEDWTVFQGNNVRISLRFTAWDDDVFAIELQAAWRLPDGFYGKIRVIYPCVIQNSFYSDNPKRVEFAVDGANGGSLEIAENTEVAVSLLTVYGANVTVKGTLSNTGEIQLYRNNGIDPSFTVAEGGSCTSSGCFRVGNNCGNGNPASCIHISGATLTEGVRDENSVVYYIANDVLDTIERACTGQYAVNKLFFKDMSDFVISRSLTIPANLSLDFENTRPIIPSGITITIHGDFKTPELEIQRSGVVVVDGGHLVVYNHNEDSFVVSGGLSAINGGTIETGSEQWTDYWSNAVKNRISISEGSSLKLYFEARNGDAESMIAQASEIDTPNVYPVIEVKYPLVLSGDMTIPRGILVESYNGITVPVGLTLTVNGQLRGMIDSVFDVYGTLVNGAPNNFGVIEFMQRTNTGPRLIIENGAVYSGRGELDIMDFGDPESYILGINLDPFARAIMDDFVSFYPIMADLFLPSGLTVIGAEAFAGDTFETVYIPPSVVSIDNSAFSGMGPLLIYGHAGTEAERFANARGFNFQNLRPQG